MIPKQYISKGFFTVEKPDHPFTYLGPDFLISDRKGLIAFFIPTKIEQSSIDKLLFRLLNSRLAYPAYTRMVLLYNYSSQDLKLNLEGQYFDKILENKDLKYIKSLIQDQSLDNKSKELKEIQKRAFRFQSQMQTNNLRFINQAEFKNKEVKPFDGKIEKVSYYNSLKKKEEKTRSNIYKYNDEIIGFKNLTKNKSDIFELAPFYEFVMRSDFNFDSGIPFFKHIQKKYLSVNNVPSSRYDPLKPIRIASLFGWFIGNISNEEELLSRKPKKRN